MKRLTSMLLVLAMLLTFAPISVFAAEGEKTVFTDVKVDDYYAEAAEILAELGIISGYPDGTYGAEKAITRAEMAAIVCRIIDKEVEAEKAKGETIFDDVAGDYWASGYINIAVKEGIINGDGNGKFRPEDEVKYEEAIKMIVCALGYAEGIEVDSIDWSRPYIEFADKKGITADLMGKKGEAAMRGDIAVMSYAGIKALEADVKASSVAAGTPVASVEEGTYTTAKKVELSSAAEGAVIYYTTNGSEPTVKSTKYTKAITISKTTTLKAIAVKDGEIVGDVMNVVYTMNIKSSGGGGGGGSTGSTATYYTVSFDLNYEGTVGTIESQSVKSGDKAIEPVEPSRDLYVFAGWYADRNCTVEYDFDTQVFSNETVYAGWYSTLYEIHSISIDDQGNATLNVSTDNGCNAKITIFDEEEKSMLGMKTIPISEKLEMTDVNTVLSEVSFPEYFVIRVDLIDENADKLCKTYKCINYTRAYEEFMAKTVDDFGDKTVLNFDESDEMNFAVLNENVDEIHISDTVNDLNENRSDLEENYYVIDNIDDSLRNLQVGDELYLDCDDGYLLTVGSFSLDGDSISIYGASEYDLKDYFDYIKVDMVIDPDSYEEEVLPEYKENDEEAELMWEAADVDITISSLKVAIPLEILLGQNEAETRKGKISGTVSAELKPHLVIKWDVNLFSENYFEFSASFEVKTGIDVSLEYSRTNSYEEEEIGYGEMLEKVAEIPMGKLKIPFGVTGLGAEVELTLPVSIEFKASANFSNTSTTKFGFSYDTNNGMRKSKDKTSSQTFTIEGELEVKIGPKLEESIEFLGEVVKASLIQSGGLYLDAKAEFNITNTDHRCPWCVSGEIGAFLEGSAKLSYKIGRISGTPVNLKLWDLKWKLLDCYYSPVIGFGLGACTNKSVEWDGQCNLSGKVTIADADTDNSNNQPLSKATVKLDNNSTNQEATTQTSSAGEYSFSNIPAGEYTITISKIGYITVTQQITITEEQENSYNAAIEAISENDNGEGIALGIVTDAVTGYGVEGLTLKIRKGLNTLTGDILYECKTSSDGTYLTKKLPAGNYTVQVIDERSLGDESERYYQTLFTIKVLGETTIPNQNGSVTNGLRADQIRIVLHWGATPSDLDSHLVGLGLNGKFHTFYRSKTYSSGGTKYADLDRDDTSSYGPETTTIYRILDGDYTFYVHDFTNRNISGASSALANSGAYVEVYLSNAQQASMTFYVPNIDGTLWTVFTYDSVNNEIKPVNTMSYKMSPDNIGLYGATNTDIDMIFDDIDNSPKEN